MSRLAVVD
jgi:hypothetical protein